MPIPLPTESANPLTAMSASPLETTTGASSRRSSGIGETLDLSVSARWFVGEGNKAGSGDLRAGITYQFLKQP